MPKTANARLKPGQRWELLNIRVRQIAGPTQPSFTVLEMYERQGRVVVYGESHFFEVHTYLHGVIGVKDKAGAFVVAPGMNAQAVDSSTELFHGQPLRLVDPTDRRVQIPVVNWAARLGELWWTPQGQQTDKDELIRRGELVCKMMFELERDGKLPLWFRRGRIMQRN